MIAELEAKMYRPIAFLFGLLLVSMPAWGQANTKDSQTLQSLLAEVRQLRQEFATQAAANQKTQILLYRLQAQQAVVARLSQRVDDAHVELNQLENERARLADEIKRHEDFIATTVNASGDRRAVEDALPGLRAKLESVDSEQREVREKESGAQEQLRLEQDKLDRLEADLDRLEKTFETASHPPSSSQ
jgi:chromosome segregation ATPase